MWALDRNLRHLFVENTKFEGTSNQNTWTQSERELHIRLMDPMCKSPGHYYTVAEYQKQLNMNPATI